MWRWMLLLAACGVDAFMSIGGGLGGRAPALGAAQRGEHSPFIAAYERAPTEKEIIIHYKSRNWNWNIPEVNVCILNINRLLRPPCVQALSSRAAEAREGFRPWPCKIRPGPRCLRSTYLRAHFLSHVLSVSISVCI